MPAYIAMSADLLTAKITPEISDPKRLIAIDTQTLGIQTQSGSKIPLHLDERGLENYLSDLFRTWKMRDAGAAKKAAFDYFSKEQLFFWVLFSLNILLNAGASLIFLADGIKERSCNILLDNPTALSTVAQISKIKKDRKGNFVWDLSFTTSGGALIQGRRTAVNPTAGILPSGESDITKPTSARVVYSAKNTSCWDVSLDRDIAKVPSAHRWFMTQFTLGFGSFFGVVFLVLTYFITRKLREPRPHRTLVEKIYHSL